MSEKKWLPMTPNKFIEEQRQRATLASISEDLKKLTITNPKVKIHNLEIIEQKILEKYRPKNVDDMNDRKNRNIADFF